MLYQGHSTLLSEQGEVCSTTSLAVCLVIIAFGVFAQLRMGLSGESSACASCEWRVYYVILCLTNDAVCLLRALPLFLI